MSASCRNWRSAGCLGLPLLQVRAHGKFPPFKAVVAIPFNTNLSTGGTLFLFPVPPAPPPSIQIAPLTITNPTPSRTKPITLSFTVQFSSPHC